ncbi:hypothetical protein BDR03DRAFT_947282 [Suillus americanus]|nr:hypothetical protein BDR03DRAFT_947282 [Suillus americanus]
MVGSNRVVSLLCISATRQWSLMQLILHLYLFRYVFQYTINIFSSSWDSCNASDTIMLIVVSEGRTVCFLLSFVSFPLLFHVKA